MDPSALTSALAMGALWQLLAALLGAAVVVVGGVFLVQGRRVPPGLLVAGVGIPALSTLGSALWASRGVVDGASHQALTHAVGGSVGTRLVGVFYMAPAAVLLLGFCAFVGVRGQPRRTGAAIAGGVLALLVPLTMLAYGIYDAEYYPPVRALAYAVLAIPTALALLASDPDESAGPEAGAAAGVTFALLVAAGETSGRSLMQFFLLLGGRNIKKVENLPNYVELASADVVGTMFPWSMVSVALALAVAAIGVSGAVAGKDRSPVGAIVAGLWLVLVPALYIAGDVGNAGLNALLVAGFEGGG